MENLDEFSLNLLAELSLNARASYAELGRRVGLSPSAVVERMRRMEEEGIIEGYAAAINPAALGLSVLAVVRMTCDGTHYHPFLKFVKTLPEVRLGDSVADLIAAAATREGIRLGSTTILVIAQKIM